ncbi:DYH10 protein, partial [Turnix velox]|nr:DYH10 protein [Turnix velox]
TSYFPFQLQEQNVEKVCFYVALDEIPREFVSDSTAYFLRDAKERVAEPKDLTEANEVLPKVIESGLLTDDTLLMLKNAIPQVKTVNVSFLSLGIIKLKMPTINLDGEVTALASVPKVVKTLESSAVTWQKLLSTALEEQLKKIPQGNGALAEIDFWHERNNALSAITEQTKLPEVQKVLEILQEAESKHVGDLQIVLRDLR